MAGLLAVRIKDGIFVGNAVSSQDEEFLFLNKVSHIINCASTETPNLYQQAGINYLSFPWRDAATTTLFDPEDRNVAQIYQFIEKGLEKGECVLVHSRDGTSRCCAVVVAYLMLKFGWSLTNTLSFMITAHPDMAIQPYFIRQLKTYAKRHELEMDIFSPGVDTSRLPLDNEQWVLKNTYFNSLAYNAEQNADLRKAVMAFEASSTTLGPKKKRRVLFADTQATTEVVSSNTTPVVFKPPDSGRSAPVGPIVVRRPSTSPHPLVTHWEEVPVQLLSPAARQLLYPQLPQALAPHPSLAQNGSAYPAQPTQLQHPAPQPSQHPPPQPPPQHPQQPQQQSQQQAQRTTPQPFSGAPNLASSNGFHIPEAASLQQPARQFADVTLPRPSPRPSLSASDELPVPALSPAARRQGTGPAGEGTAFVGAPGIVAPNQYIQPPLNNMRQINPHLQRLQAQGGGLSTDMQNLTLNGGPANNSGSLSSYIITNRNASAGTTVEKRSTQSTQQIINPNLLRNSAANPNGPAAGPPASDAAGRRPSRKAPASPFVVQPRKGSPLPRRENRSTGPSLPATGPGHRTDARYSNSPLHDRGGYTASTGLSPSVLRAQYTNSPSRYDSPSRGAYGSDAGESDDGKKGLKKRRPSRTRDVTPTGVRPPASGVQPAATPNVPESRLMKPTASFLRKTTRS